MGTREHDKSGGRSPPAPDVESTERWVSGKSEQQLLSDLKVYSARLQEDPRGTQDRLRVAAIQLRLGRIEEALIHYEGVLRAYVAQDQVLSAIALCKRILSIYPDIPRLQRILAALYARVPHQESPGPTPVTPIAMDKAPIVLQDEAAGGGQEMVVNRLFSGSAQGQRSHDLLDDDDFRPTIPYLRPAAEEGEAPILLTHKKKP